MRWCTSNYENPNNDENFALELFFEGLLGNGKSG
jgi:hypothetical protein